MRQGSAVTVQWTWVSAAERHDHHGLPSAVAWPGIHETDSWRDPTCVAESICTPPRLYAVCWASQSSLWIKFKDFSTTFETSFTIFAVQCYASVAYVIMRCLCCVFVCLSCSYVLSKRINISSKFFHHRVATSFCFSIPNVLAIFRLEPPNRDVECRWGRLKSQFSTNISLCDR